jgi:hypothetical protein
MTSCDYFDKKKVNANDLLTEELKTINWNDVDEYPTFESCNQSVTKEAKKACFETTLTTHISNKVVSYRIIVEEALNDTLYLEFKISKQGELSILNIDNSANVKSQIPEIETYIKRSLDSLPKILPAIKRGQHVTTEFKLPLIIKVE